MILDERETETSDQVKEDMKMLVETIKLYEGREDATLTAYVIAEKGELYA